MSLYRRFHDRFGAAGVALGAIALILALGGTALAAKGALTGKQKKEVEKIAKKFAGKPGAPGATGPGGPAGPQGPAGAAGADGEDGANGVSAKATSFSGNAHGCTEGGIEVTSAEPTVFVCNGKKGTNGVSAKATSFSGAQGSCTEGGVKVESAEPAAYVCNGSPWTAGGTLPKGATETGAWYLEKQEASEFKTIGLSENVITFPIPLSAPIANNEEGCSEEPATRTNPCHYFYIGPGGHEYNPFTAEEEASGAPEHCHGSVDSPSADSGTLCVYIRSISNLAALNLGIEDPFETGAPHSGVGKTGAALTFITFGAEPTRTAYGVFAVTG